MQVRQNCISSAGLIQEEQTWGGEVESNQILLHLEKKDEMCYIWGSDVSSAQL